MKKIEDVLGIDRETIERDYLEIGNLRGVAQKYGTSHGTIASMFDRLKINYDHQKVHKISVNENYFDNPNNPNVMYWLGFLLADGCIHDNYLRLTLAEKDLIHLERFRDDLSSFHKISTQISKNSQRNNNWNDSITHSLSIGSKKIINIIREYGLVPRKTFITKFPIQFINNNQVNIYCRGYFDGDGCWSFHEVKSRPNHAPQLTFSLRGTKEFLYDFNYIMVKNANLPERCFKRKISASGGIGSLTYVGNRICACIARWLYADIISGVSNRYLERKFELIKSILDMNKTPICFDA